jgi:quinate dehydrogenase
LKLIITMPNGTVSKEKNLYLVGIGVKHSIAPPMHNFIAKSLGLSWTFHNTECFSIQDVLELGRLTTTMGLVITMPYKTAVMTHLDDLDALESTIGACNNVSRDPSNPKKLRGTNTDWLGIKGCLLEKGDEQLRPASSQQLAPPALIVGDGGAS